MTWPETCQREEVKLWTSCLSQGESILSDSDHFLLYLNSFLVKETHAVKGMSLEMMLFFLVFTNFIQFFQPNFFLFSLILSCPVVNQKPITWQLEDKHINMFISFPPAVCSLSMTSSKFLQCARLQLLLYSHMLQRHFSFSTADCSSSKTVTPLLWKHKKDLSTALLHIRNNTIRDGLSMGEESRSWPCLN